MSPRLYAISASLAHALFSGLSLAKQASTPNSQPNPYRTVEGRFQLPAGRAWGQVPTVDIDSKGHIWVLDRCGETRCTDSMLDPVLEFDASGKLLKSFGGGMFVFPHGIFVDKQDNIWTTDGEGAVGPSVDGSGKVGKGQQVVKFNQDGKILMTIGKAGVAGEGPDTFNKPSDVIVAANGDIFVADGHGGDDSNVRVS